MGGETSPDQEPLVLKPSQDCLPSCVVESSGAERAESDWWRPLLRLHAKDYVRQMDAIGAIVTRIDSAVRNLTPVQIL